MINTQSINSETVRSGPTCEAATDDIEIIEDVPYSEAERSLLENTLKVVDETGVKFRFKGKKVFLTYPGHLNKDEYTEWIRGRFSSHTLNVVIAHEGADSATNYEHSHVLIQSNKDMDIKNPRGFDYESEDSDNPHPNIQKIAGKLHLQNIYRYLCKEDKSNLFLLEKKLVKKEEEVSLIRKLSECNTLFEALDLYQGKGKGKYSAMEIKATWVCRKRKQIRAPYVPKLRTWHPKVLGVIGGAIKEMNPRSVYGFRGREGGEGKSDIGYELVRRYPTKWRYIENVPLEWDRIVTHLVRFVEEGWDQTGIVIDIPREGETKGFCKILENLKSATWTTYRYDQPQIEGHRFMQVVFFCNKFPILTGLSLDRWRLYDLIADEEIEGEYKLQVLNIRKPKKATPDDLRAKRLARAGQVPNATTFGHLNEINFEPIYEPGEFIEITDDAF